MASFGNPGSLEMREAQMNKAKGRTPKERVSISYPKLETILG
jgi:hypothetical protein